MRFVAVFVSIVVFMCGVSAAQPLTIRELAEHLDRAYDAIQAQVSQGEVEADAVLGIITASPLDLREAPPHGPLNLLIGPQIEATIEPGTVVEIVDEKYIGTLDGRQVWYSVRPLYPAAIDLENTEWWINAGISGPGGQTPTTMTLALPW